MYKRVYYKLSFNILSRKYSKSRHKNQACHGWNGATVYVQLLFTSILQNNYLKTTFFPKFALLYISAGQNTILT